MELIAKIREALGLDEKATEDQILEALTAEKGSLKVIAKAAGLAEDSDAKAITDAIGELASRGDEKSLEDRAKAEGKKLVSEADYADLVKGSAAGQTALEELRVSKFEAAYDTAVNEQRITTDDDAKKRLRGWYDADAEGCLADLAARPKLVNTSARGTGKAPADEAPDGVDPERHELNERVKARMKADKVDFATALDAELAEEASA